MWFALFVGPVHPLVRPAELMPHCHKWHITAEIEGATSLLLVGCLIFPHHMLCRQTGGGDWEKLPPRKAQNPGFKTRNKITAEVFRPWPMNMQASHQNRTSLGKTPKKQELNNMGKKGAVYVRGRSISRLEPDDGDGWMEIAWPNWMQ